MEFKYVILVPLLTVCMYLVDGVYPTAKEQSGMSEKEKELTELLNIVKEQNRKLVLQNQRLQQVWFGMQQMCKALSFPTCDCNQTNEEGSSVNTSHIHDRSENQNIGRASNQTSSLKVLSIKSSGSISNVTQISVIYDAPVHHFVHWIGGRYDQRMLRKGDKKSETVPGSGIYVATIVVEDLQSVRTLYFRLHDDEHSISIRLNTTAAEKPLMQNVTAPYSNLIEVNKAYTAPQGTTDLTITAVINLNYTFIGDSAIDDILLTGLNTSTNPATYFETFGIDSGAIRLNMSKRTNETTTCDILISHNYIKYGGILTIHIPYIESSRDGMIDVFSFGPTIKIYAYGSTEVIPKNTVGTMMLQNETYIFSPSHSISCLGIGNPRPTAAILKLNEAGGYSLLATENAYLDKYSQQEVLSLAANQRSNEGRYMCRVSNGMETVETFTEAVIVREAVIVESSTGIVKNTSKIFVISCKARGKPRPDLDFRLYTEYGPFMIKSGLFKFTRKTSGKYSSRVTLTLSAVDDVDIHTVFCFAAQGDRQRNIEKSRKINIFPEGRDINWDLYHRVQDAQVF